MQTELPCPTSPDSTTWKTVFEKFGQSPEAIIGRIQKHVSQRKALFAAVYASLGDVAGKRIVEIGCGTALECLIFALRGAQCVGVDYESAALRYAAGARSLFAEAIPLSFCQGTGFMIPLKDNCADLVLSQGFLEHFTPEQTAALLQEQCRILKAGGVLLVDVPNHDSPYELYKRIYTLFRPWIYGKERGIRRGEINAQCAALGMRSVARYGWSFKGYPFKNPLDFLFMLPLLTARSVLSLVNAAHDSIGMVFIKGSRQ